MHPEEHAFESLMDGTNKKQKKKLKKKLKNIHHEPLDPLDAFQRMPLRPRMRHSK
jgi:hypothetical protein